MTAIFKITDGTDTIDFVGGPFYLANWRPAIAKYKGDGVFLDSPLSTGRHIAHRVFQNATERIDLKLRANNDDDAARQTNLLLTLAERAAEHSITGGIFDPVWLEVKSPHETNTRYAVVVKADLADLENPFAQPFLQRDCSAVMDNLVFIVERSEWTDSPPGELNDIFVTESVDDYNLIDGGTFEEWAAETSRHMAFYWDEINDPDPNLTTNTVTAERAYEGTKSVKLVGTSGADRGIYRDLDDVGLVSGQEYTITAKALVEDGAASLVAYDGGGFSNAVRDDTSDRNVEILTNTSFESDLSGWGWRSYTLSASRSNAYAYDGSWSLRLDWAPTRGAGGRRSLRGYYYSDAIAVPTNSAQFTLRLGSLRSTAAAYRFYVGLSYYDANMSWISTSSSRHLQMETTGEWHFNSYNFPVPSDENVAYVTIRFLYAGNIDDFGSSFSYFFDAVSLKATVPGIAVYNEWQTLSVTKTATAGGIRVALVTESTNGGTAFFDDVQLGRVYAPEGSQDDYAFVANSCMNYNLMYVFTDDGGAFSTNLLDNTLPYKLLPAVPVTDDAIYFGTPIGPFSNISIDLASIIDTTSVSVTWEYYSSDLSDWDTLDFRDTSEALQQSGKNVISWAVPDDWTRTTINSESAYWVRAVVTIGGTPDSTAIQQNTHPHIVTRAYFEVDEEQVSGHMRSLMKYRITNESGPQQTVVSEVITTGADDVFASGGSLTSGGSTADLGAGDSIGLRFQSLALPPGVTITSARLYCKTVTASPSASSKTFLFEVTAHDVGDSPAFSTYSDYIGRARTYTGSTSAAFESLEVIERANEQYVGFGDLRHLIQYMVLRSDWASGNDLTLFIDPSDFQIPALDPTDYIRFSMYEGDANSWILELKYTSTARYTTSVYMGARSVSRGSNFQAHVEATRAALCPTGLSIDMHNGAHVQLKSFAGSYIPGAYAIYHNWTHVEENYGDRVSFIFSPPLSQEYEGRFRAFARVGLSTTGGEIVRFRLRQQIGSGGSSFTNETSVLAAEESVYYEGNYPRLVDLGPVTVPQLGGADQLKLTVQTLTEDEVGIYIFSLVLIPIDEWYLEAAQPTDSAISLDNETYMEVNSADSTPEPITATIRDRQSTAVRNNMVIAGSPATLAPARTQRVWMATTAIVTADAPVLNVVSSHNDIIHKVSAKNIRRYLGMRGSA